MQWFPKSWVQIDVNYLWQFNKSLHRNWRKAEVKLKTKQNKIKQIHYLIVIVLSPFGLQNAVCILGDILQNAHMRQQNSASVA